MSTVRAADLPEGSVVATTKRVWIKRRDRIDGPYWIAAEAYAFPVSNLAIDSELRHGADVLRVGDGQGQPC
jgi:hypothetical protein